MIGDRLRHDGRTVAGAGVAGRGGAASTPSWGPALS